MQYMLDGTDIFSLHRNIDIDSYVVAVGNIHGICVGNDWDDVERDGDNYIADDFLLFEAERHHDLMLCRYCGKVERCHYEHNRDSTDIYFFRKHIDICKKTRRQIVTMMHILLVFAIRESSPYRIDFILKKCFARTARKHYA